MEENKNNTRANTVLCATLATAGPRLPEPIRTNILALAQSKAARAYATGERFHAGNRTTYPAKHYADLERHLGPLSAPALAAFDDAYNAHLAWHADVTAD